MRKWRCEEAWCGNGDTVNPSLTYIGGFLLSQLKFLLGIFKSLGVLVQLILSSLQLLLQSYQIVLKLRRVSVRGQFQRWSAGRERERAQARERHTHTHRETHATGEDRTGQGGKREEKSYGSTCMSESDTLVAASSAVSSFSSAVWNSSNTLSLSSSVTRNFFSNSLISSSNYTCI